MDVFAQRLSRGQLIALDCLAALGFTLAYLSAVSSADLPTWARLALPVGLSIPLAVRRLWPRTVFWTVLPVAVAAMALMAISAAYVAPAYALYLVALTARGRGWILAAVVTVTALAALTIAGTPASAPVWWTSLVGQLLPGAAAFGAVWTIGRAVAARRAYAARLSEQAVVEERLRIARELHDVVAHSMGLIAVKAGVANHVIRTRPDEASDALRVIETASRSALVEMRHLLGVLRTPEADLRPAPGLDGLEELADRARMAGVRVDLDVDPGPLPEGAALAVYRIVQEALTNVVKHAAPTSCRVKVEVGEVASIEVVDDGPGRGPVEFGHGLVGMRERIMMYGGAFAAGPRPEGGFRVAATLPYGEIS
ncbi:sensor histidine kinase [Nonomuraea sp. NPDC050556]|uniref:sensor histidine kinase n=1 Tax=Nonomuraea sp. NPDC050556 TaxID=3364369 RepID=UPI0037B56170